MQAYAEYILEESGSYRYLDEIPESLRMHAKFDTEAMARDMEIELYAAEGENGEVYGQTTTASTSISSGFIRSITTSRVRLIATSMPDCLRS